MKFGLVNEVTDSRNQGEARGKGEVPAACVDIQYATALLASTMLFIYSEACTHRKRMYLSDVYILMRESRRIRGGKRARKGQQDEGERVGQVERTRVSRTR